jgi:hypothetical protein
MIRRRMFGVVLMVMAAPAVATADLETPSAGEFRLAGAWKPKIGPRVRFDGKGPVTAREEDGVLRFSADLRRLDTGESTDHTKEAFEVSRYPIAELRVATDDLEIPADGARVTSSASGTLTLHGKTRIVEVSYIVTRTGADYHIRSASFRFDYTKFGVPRICRFVGNVCAEPMVDITVAGLRLRDR